MSRKQNVPARLLHIERRAAEIAILAAEKTLWRRRDLGHYIGGWMTAGKGRSPQSQRLGAQIGWLAAEIWFEAHRAQSTTPARLPSMATVRR
jgi:hypothetical protein